MEEETDDERVRFTCAAWIYERAWGKPKAYDPSIEKAPRVVFDLAHLSREQRGCARSEPWACHRLRRLGR
jgi:hypothetical protein